MIERNHLESNQSEPLSGIGSEVSRFRRLGRSVSSAAPPILIVVVLIVGWELAVSILDISTFVVPSPSLVLSTLVDRPGFFLNQTWVTTQEILYGFLLSAGIGIALAILVARFRTVDRALYPILVVLQIVPKVALAPLLILWLGFGMGPKLVLIVLIAFFPVTLNMLAGLRSVDPNLRLLLQSVGASRNELMLRVEIPHSLPSLMTGLQLAITLAVIGAIVGEFSGASAGLGYLIFFGSTQLDTPLVFAALILVSLLGVILYYSVVLFDRTFISWAPDV